MKCAIAVLRLERRVRDERIRVGRLDDLAPRAANAWSTLPSLRRLVVAASARELVGLRLAKPSLLCVAVGPSSQVTFSLLARRLRLPPAVGDDGDTAEAGSVRAGPAVVRRSIDEACFTPGSALISSRFALATLAAEDRALLEDRAQHARQREVDAEDRLAGDDVLDVSTPFSAVPMIL